MQCLILDALGKHRPQYAHCSLILGSDKQKLSKRHGAASVGQFRQEVGDMLRVCHGGTNDEAPVHHRLSFCCNAMNV